MRIVFVMMLFVAMLAISGLSFAQEMYPEQPEHMQPEISRATIQEGPVLRAGLPASADIFINGQFAMRIPDSAGGLNPMQRAEIISDRLNEAFEAGETWQNVWVSQSNGLWIVSLNGRLIATADINSARAMGISEGALASRWANQTVVAMGGQPAMIAAQLEPIPGRVAGVIEEIDVAWGISPTRTVPVVNVATGETIGNVTIGGPQNMLNMINLVALYEYSANGALVRSFVPTGATMPDDQISRVQGVGIVSLPADMIPEMEFRIGTEVQTAVTQRGVEWNTRINTQLRQWNIPLGAITRVVPLYSMDENQVIGAAQVTGPSASVNVTQAVIVQTQNDMLQLRATQVAIPPVGTPAAQTDVVVSSLIYWLEDEAAIPAAPTVPPATPGQPMP